MRERRHAVEDRAVFEDPIERTGRRLCHTWLPERWSLSDTLGSGAMTLRTLPLVKLRSGFLRASIASKWIRPIGAVLRSLLWKIRLGRPRCTCQHSADEGPFHCAPLVLWKSLRPICATS